MTSMNRNLLHVTIFSFATLILGITTGISTFEAIEFVNLESVIRTILFVIVMSIFLSLNLTFDQKTYSLVLIFITLFFTFFLEVNLGIFNIALFLFLPLLFYIFLNYSNFRLLHFISYFSILLFIVFSSLLFLNNNSGGMITLLSGGYDRAFHFQLFKHSFGSAENAPIVSFLGEYPPGLSIYLRIVASILGIDNFHILSGIYVYVIGLFLLIILNCLFMAKIFYSISKNLFTRFVIVFIILVFSHYSYMIGAGFDPYLFGLLLINIIIWLELRSNKRFLPTLLLFFILLITSPALIIIPFVFICITRFGNKAFLRRLNPTLIFLFIAITSLVIIFSLKFFESFGWRQILAQGGIEPLSMFFYSILSTSILLLFYFAHKPNAIIESFLITIFVAAQLNFIPFALLTSYFNNEISYYAQKQAYVSTVFLSLTLLSLITKIKFNLIYGYSFPKKFISILFILFIFTSSIRPGTYAFTQSSISKQLIVFSSSKLKGSQTIYGPQILSAANKLFFSGKDCGIYRSNTFDSDLNSRWITSLGGTVTLECFLIMQNLQSKSDFVLMNLLYKYDQRGIFFYDSVSLNGIDKISEIKNKWLFLSSQRS
jgi:hypothetical protein